MIGELSNFRRGGKWDAQRIGGKNHRDYVNYATIAIGLYAAAAGIPQNEILEIQNLYAKQSKYAAGTKFDTTYQSLPRTNIENTNIGYKLYESARIRPDAK